jgi:predicted Zn-dependent protease with MMP-like domain
MTAVTGLSVTRPEDIFPPVRGYSHVVHDADASARRASPRRKRRDRHGHGMRGPLAPPEVPLHRTRAEQFGDLVLEAVARLEPRWEAELAQVEFAVQEVPDAEVEVPGDEVDPVPLASLDLGSQEGDPGPARKPRIVLFRRALLARADGEEELADLVLDVVVEEVAQLLGVDPEVVDPDYEGE